MLMQAYLDQEIKKICPIDGISFNDLNDRLTWRISYAKEATEEQKAAAQKILNEFVWDDEKKEKLRKSDRDALYVNDLLYRKAFKEYLSQNPSASFSDFMDYLEATKD